MPASEAVPKTHDAIRLFLVLQRTYRTMLSICEESKRKMDLGDSDFRVLEALLHNGPLPVNLLGQMIDLTTGSITTAVDRMEAKWLVARKNHPDDRRIRLVELTAKGRRLIEKASLHYSIDMEAAVSALSRGEQAKLVELLRRLDAHHQDKASRNIRALP
jgi:MarR family transcriptional regulator, 2-MHQ and catechol-resistance regulon repressor